MKRLATSFLMPCDAPRAGIMSKPARRTRSRGRFVAALSSVVATALLVAPAATARPTTKFVSKRYGYSIVFPGRHSRWAATFATEDWSSDLIGGIGAPGIDTFSDLKTGRSYLLAARRTDKGLQQWTDFVVSARSPLCGTPQPLPDATLGGAPGLVLSWTGSDGYRAIVITALLAGRGFLMLVPSPTPLSDISDVRAFEAARRSFRLVQT